MSIVQLRIGICCRLLKVFFFFKERQFLRGGRGALSLLLRGLEMSCGRQGSRFVTVAVPRDTRASPVRGNVCVFPSLVNRVEEPGRVKSSPCL